MERSRKAPFWTWIEVGEISWLKQILGLQKEESPVCSVVVAAAGSSSRMKGEDKLLLPLGDAPVIIQTLRAIDVCPCVKEVIVVKSGNFDKGAIIEAGIVLF